MMQLSVHMMEAHNFKYDGSGRQYAVEPDQESLALKGKLKLMSSIKVHSRVSGLDWIRRNQNIRILYKFPDPIKKIRIMILPIHPDPEPQHCFVYFMYKIWRQFSFISNIEKFIAFPLSNQILILLNVKFLISNILIFISHSL